METSGTGGTRKELGEYLVEAGIIDQKVLFKALEIQKVQKKRIGQILINMGVADDEDVAEALALQLKIPFLHLGEVKIEPEVIALIPPEMVENYLLIPIRKTDQGLLVAMALASMANPSEIYALEDLRFVTGMHIQIAVASQKDILEEIERYYPKPGIESELDSEPRIGEDIQILTRNEAAADDMDAGELLGLAKASPVVRFSKAIFADAIKLNASDIHIEPQQGGVVVRYRIDGIMREIVKTDKLIHASLVSRIKVLADMDITIRRKPQDGKFQIIIRDKQYDMRVSTIPASYGEKVTIRILDQGGALRRLEDMDLPKSSYQEFYDVLNLNQGIFLVTGPTGSGKSSTLYTCLNRLNSRTVNIMTVENPIEFDIAGINQVQINPKAGITFADGLRSILRQDPDVIMVGEIRDYETAAIAFQAAQTGHLVLSTLHTNDAASAVIRLLELGIQPFLVSASLIAVVGQRLVRRICKKCKAPDPLGQEILKQFPQLAVVGDKAAFWKGAGCEACQYTGYSGRLGIFEFLRITAALRNSIASNVSAHALQEVAQKEGFQLMGMDGIKKAFGGLTTVEEVLRVTLLPGIDSIPPVTTSSTRVLGELEKERMPFETFSSQIGALKSKKVLLVDDNEITLKLISNILGSEGYRIITGNNGLEAIKLALQEKPDLIVTDYLMPEMDGMTLIKELKSQLATRYIPVMMLTSKDDVDSEVSVIGAGADDYLTKPVNPKKFLARANRLLGRAINGEL